MVNYKWKRKSNNKKYKKLKGDGKIMLKANVLAVVDILKKISNKEMEAKTAYAVDKNIRICVPVTKEVEKFNSAEIDKRYQAEADSKVNELAKKDDKGNILRLDNNEINFGENSEIYKEFITDIKERYASEILPLKDGYESLVAEDINLNFWKLDVDKLPEMTPQDIGVLGELGIILIK